MRKLGKTILTIILALCSWGALSIVEAMNRKCAVLLQVLDQHESQNRYFEIANLTLNIQKSNAAHLFVKAKTRIVRVLLASRYPSVVDNSKQFIMDHIQHLFIEDPDLALMAVVLTHQNPPPELSEPLLVRAREHLTRISVGLEFPQEAQFTSDSHFRALKLLGEDTEQQTFSYNPPVDEIKLKTQKRDWLAGMKKILERELKSPESIELGIPKDERPADEIIDLLTWISKHPDYLKIRVVWTSLKKIPLDQAVMGHVHTAKPRFNRTEIPNFGTTAFLSEKISEEDFLTENAIAYLIIFGNESDLRLVKGLAEMKFNSLYELLWWRLIIGQPGFPE
jgi:hypothetical protein